MLYVVSWLTDFATLLFVFASMRSVADSGASPFLQGSIGAIFFLASCLCNLISGKLSDHLGRRGVALCGAGLFLLGMGGVLGSRSVGPAFYVSYFLVGAALGTFYPPIMAWLSHGKSSREIAQTFALFCLSFNLGILCAQLVGGWLYRYHGREMPIRLAMGLMICSAVCVLLVKPRSGSASSEREEKPHTVQMAQRFARLTWIANLGGMFAMSIFWFLLPQLVVEMGVPADRHGAILGIGRLATLSTFGVMHFFRQWRFRFAVSAVVQTIGVAGLIAIVFAETALQLTLGVVAISVLMGYNYLASLFYNATAAASERRGGALGLNESFLAMGAVGGSLVGGLVGELGGSRAPFQLAAGLLVTLLIVQVICFVKMVVPLRDKQEIQDATSST